MWQLLRRCGCPEVLLRIWMALHDHTDYRVKVYGDVSSAWRPSRGLREGCPSSPPVFNIYHDAVMRDFRVRGRAAAAAQDEAPGVEWAYKVTARLGPKNADRTQSSGDSGLASQLWTTTIGDLGFADDTTLTRMASEMPATENMFVATLADWEESESIREKENVSD